ncbi:MAG: glycosyltransferase [Chloroflexi bacterium]|nr:glycosyltransferase [Chloroflexota bacterium]
MSEELVKRGHQVTVITSDAAGRLERKERLPAGSSLVNGVKVVRLPLTLSRVSLLQKVERTLYWRMAGLGKALRRPALWGLMQDPLGWKLLRCLLKEQCDILHTTPVTRSSIAATGMAARRINVPAGSTSCWRAPRRRPDTLKR